MANYNSNYTGLEIDQNIGKVIQLTKIQSCGESEPLFISTDDIFRNVNMTENGTYVLKLLINHGDSGSGSGASFHFVREGEE